MMLFLVLCSRGFVGPGKQSPARGHGQGGLPHSKVSEAAGPRRAPPPCSRVLGFGFRV